jgi:hypothetical protein
MKCVNNHGSFRNLKQMLLDLEQLKLHMSFTLTSKLMAIQFINT